MSQKEEFLKVDYRSREVKMGIWVFGFKDNDSHIAFVPSLNLTAYGATEKEAFDMLFEDVIQDFMKNILDIQESDVTKELNKYGWQRSRYFKKKFYNTPFIDKQGILKNFNLPDETPVKSMFEYA